MRDKSLLSLAQWCLRFYANFIRYKVLHIHRSIFRRNVCVCEPLLWSKKKKKNDFNYRFVIWPHEKSVFSFDLWFDNIFEILNLYPTASIYSPYFSISESAGFWIRLWRRMVFARSTTSTVIGYTTEVRSSNYWTIVMVWIDSVARFGDRQPSIWILFNQSRYKIIIVHASHSSSGMVVEQLKQMRSFCIGNECGFICSYHGFSWFSDRLPNT